MVKGSATPGGTYDDIDGADSDTYTPIVAIEDDPNTLDVNETYASDEGMFLRATVMYRDKASPTEDDTGTAEVNEATALNEDGHGHDGQRRPRPARREHCSHVLLRRR